MKKLTAVIQVKTTIEQVAQECLELFGEGANPESEIQEMFFKLCNTPVSHGYCRPYVAEHIATALQYLIDNDQAETDNAKIIKVEWHGQDMIESADEEGNPTYVQELFQVGTTEPVELEDGSMSEARPVHLGRF